MPFDDVNNTSYGVVFLELEDNIKALIAVDILNNREFDKKHIMTACIAEDFDLINDFAYQSVDEFPKHKDTDITYESHYLVSWIHSGSVKGMYNAIKEDKTITEIAKLVPEAENDILSLRYSPNGLYLVKQCSDHIIFL